jgi:hypothetical protein
MIFFALTLLRIQMALIIYTADLYDLNNIAGDQNTKVDPQNKHDLNFFLIRSFSL